MGEMNILEWTVAYIKYKDSIRGKIQSIDHDGKSIVNVLNKDGSKSKHVCVNLLSQLDVKSLQDEKISCLNKKENLDWLISNWEALKDKQCIFFFVNLKKSENWAINPHMHHSVTDKSALKSGLKSLFDSISSAD